MKPRNARRPLAKAGEVRLGKDRNKRACSPKSLYSCRFACSCSCSALDGCKGGQRDALNAKTIFQRSLSKPVHPLYTFIISQNWVALQSTFAIYFNDIAISPA